MSSTSIFTGSSQFSNDFQSVVSRAVAIASLPINRLNDDKTALTSQGTALTSLDAKFTALQKAVADISAAVDGGSFETVVSDDKSLSVSLGSSAAEGSYSVRVLDIGAYASSLSKTSWDSSGDAKTYKLRVGSQEFDIKGSNNSAASVAAAVNAKAGDKVRATVVNVGSSSSPDYRISLRALALGDTPVDLQYGGTSLQDQQTVGKLASYEVNASGKTVTSASRTVSIADGVNVTLLSAESGNPVDITVSRSTGALATAMQAFATAYNDTVSAVDAHRGVSGGALSGQSVVYELSRVLSGISSYSTSSGAITNLSSLGLEIDKEGTMSFNTFTLLGSDILNSAGVTSFLGNSAEGGFLKSATDALNGVEASTTGILKVAEQGNKDSLSSVEKRITEQKERVDRLQTRLNEQMAAADALIASMEQKYSYLTSLFESMKSSSD